MIRAVGDLLADWDLRPDGEPIAGHRSAILPVRSGGVPAVLKVAPERHNANEHLVLRQWNADGAVRLLRADPRRGALLLERLRADDLTTIPDAEACVVVADLYRHLHRPALPQLPALSGEVPRWISNLRALPRNAPIPRRLVEQAITHLSALVDRPDIQSGRDVTLHGNLHYGKVHAADRLPWLAIGPSPLRGDPHYDVAPMLWTRWDPIGHHARGVIRHRLFVLTDTADLDEDRARAWTLARAVLEALHLVRRGVPADSAELTRFVTVAKAVQD